ncbi:hypothetical protein AAFP35_06125 [Gordonia sp. CPCC 206044]|uniref:hypothetical protein n=1 Tax=Gordonia sp. CPCC 206044 TaxID=3140793 RepID=UPI003AF34BA7
MSADSDDSATEVATDTVTVRSRSGTITVVTTTQGLPVSVHIERSALSLGEGALAAEILGLCRQASMVAGIRLREQLTASGAGRDVLEALRLPTTDDLARVECLADATAQVPVSWLHTVSGRR